MDKQLPQQFVDMLSQWPLLAPLAADLLTAPEVSVRFNPDKKTPDIAIDVPVPWCQYGFYLSARPKFTFDPAMHQGRYYVQDASSMAILAAVRQAVQELCPNEGLRYLDACAAPGGKTTAAISALPHGSLVVANEYDYRRAEILAENVAKWGYPYAMVTRGDTSKLRKLSEFFDIVAVDAPCSGEGMMRKEQKAVEQWSPRLVEQCAALQREILDNAWRALKPGGVLIYSTCTFNRSENEENLNYIIEELGAEPLKIDELERFVEIAHGIDTDYPCYRFLPGRVKGEGLFMAMVRKPKGVPQSRKTNFKAVPLPKQVSRWLCGEWSSLQKGDELYALPIDAASAMAEVDKVLDVLSAGVHVATVKGKDYVPDQGLALSLALNADAFPRVDVKEADAIAYLQRQPVSVDAPKGIILLTYQGVPLGFEKNLGIRANNLYPKNWRILSSL